MTVRRPRLLGLLAATVLLMAGACSDDNGESTDRNAEVTARADSSQTASVSPMDEVSIKAWFDQYLTAFAARGRGESDDLNALLEYYGVPLLVTTDDAARALTAAEDVTAFARQQVEGLRAANYDRSQTLRAEVTTLNATSAVYKAAFARLRADGSEISRLGVTYLITNGPAGLRISVLAVHAP